MQVFSTTPHGVGIDHITLDVELPRGTGRLLVAVRGRTTATPVSRGALLKYSLNASGQTVLPSGPFSKSPSAGTFAYLAEEPNATATHLPEDTSVTALTLILPPDVDSISLSGQRWRPQSAYEIDEICVITIPPEGIELSDELPVWLHAHVPAALRTSALAAQLDYAPREPGNADEHTRWAIHKEILPEPQGMASVFAAVGTQRPVSARKLRVAIICDEFTFNSFSPEFETVILEPDRWAAQLEEFKPDLFFCESAWSGVDSAKRPWRGQIYGSIKFPYENRTKLFGILNDCKKRGIPTVFWNKEDPTHFFDRVNDFVSTAARFDFVFTTAEEMIPEYDKILGRGRTGLVQFAAQPLHFNPLPGDARAHSAVFAGAWYRVHPERSQTMREGFDYISRSAFDLVIHDRNWGSTSPDFAFPKEYERYRRPSIPHSRTATAYKQATFGLNFNTVVSSPTMFARRIFELAATGTGIISNHSPGIERIYGDDVIYFDRAGVKELDDYSPDDLRAMTRRALEKTLAEHTYRHRYEAILSFAGIPHSSSRPAPTLVAPVTNHVEADRAISYFQHMGGIFSRLLLAVSEDVTPTDVGLFYNRYSTSMTSVVSERLLRKESIPSTSITSTPDNYILNVASPPTKREVHLLQLHSQYTHFPVVATDNSDLSWEAVPLRTGALIPANRLTSALLTQDVSTALGVPR